MPGSPSGHAAHQSGTMLSAKPPINHVNRVNVARDQLPLRRHLYVVLQSVDLSYKSNAYDTPVRRRTPLANHTLQPLILVIQLLPIVSLSTCMSIKPGFYPGHRKEILLPPKKLQNSHPIVPSLIMLRSSKYTVYFGNYALNLTGRPSDNKCNI